MKSAKTLEQLVREINRDDQRLEGRMRALESLASWVRTSLYRWLLGFASFAGYTVTLKEPPQ